MEILHHRLRPFISLLGIDVNGDLGGLTIWTNRNNRKIAMVKSPPLEPPSPKQIIQRARFATASANWVALNVVEKNTWEIMSLVTNQSMNGIDLWLSLSLVPDEFYIDTLERQSNLIVTRPPFVI